MKVINAMTVMGLLGLFVITVEAKPIEYVRDYRYQTQLYDTRDTARVQALDGVRHVLVQELGTYVQSVIKIKQDQLGNSYMSNDIVTLSAGIVAMNVLQEEWNKVDYYVKAKMHADPDEVVETVKALHTNHELEDMLRTSQLELENTRSEIARLQMALAKTGNNQDYLDSVQTLELEQLFQLSMQAYVRGNFSKAVTLLQDLANKGSAKAQGRLGWMYERGIGVERDYDRAREWYETAMKSNNGFAFVRRGYMFERGLGELQDYARAVNYYHRAIDLGNVHAYAHLGFLYYTGRGVTKEYDLAYRHFKKSAEAGSYIGMAFLSLSYDLGIGVDIDHEQSFKWGKRAAKKGNPLGLAMLGKHYLKGHGTEQDFDKALELLRSAELRGNPLGIALLGYMYENGLSDLDEDNWH